MRFWKDAEGRGNLVPVRERIRRTAGPGRIANAEIEMNV
jgi:hypothetical protein